MYDCYFEYAHMRALRATHSYWHEVVKTVSQSNESELDSKHSMLHFQSHNGYIDQNVARCMSILVMVIGTRVLF